MMVERNRFFSVAESQQALAESENRRKVLLQTIQETQETIRAQSLRLDETEQLTKEQQQDLDKVKNKERDYQRYITNLERQLVIGKQRQEGQLKILQDAENKLELLEEDASTLRCSLARLQGDCKHKDDKFKACSSRLKELEDENASLVAELESANQKLLMQLESLATLREDNALLDKQAKSESMDAERLRKENTTLFSDMKQLQRQVATLSEKSNVYTKEISMLTTQLQTSNTEEKRLKSQVAELQKINSALKDMMSSFTIEKDRFFQEKLEFCEQIQNLAIEKDAIFREQMLAEDEANEMSSDLARMKRLAGKLAEENKRLTEELNEIQKVRGLLPIGALGSRYGLDQQRDEKMHSTGQRKESTFQQDDLYEDEIRSLEQQILDTQKMLKAAMKEKDWALEVRDELIEKLQNEVRKLREEKHELNCLLEMQRDVSEAESQQQKLECICKCHVRSRREGCEDVCGHRSRNEGSQDIHTGFGGCPRREDASACSFAAVNSQDHKQMMQKREAEKDKLQSSNLLVEDIFCASWYAEKQLMPKYSDHQVPSQFEGTEVKSKYRSAACNLLGAGFTDLTKNKTMLDEKIVENAAITDQSEGGGSRVKDTSKMRDKGIVEVIQDSEEDFCLDGRHLQMDTLEKHDCKAGPEESIAIDSSGTEAIRQEDAVKTKEENSKVEIYVCVADDKDEKFFEEGSAAFLVLLPPNSKDISVINDNAVGLKHHAVTDDCVTGDKNNVKPLRNLPGGESITENEAHTPDIQVYRLASDKNKTFRNCFVGQNVLEESVSPGTSIFGTIEPPSHGKSLAAALTNENIQLPNVAMATDQTGDLQ